MAPIVECLTNLKSSKCYLGNQITFVLKKQLDSFFVIFLLTDLWGNNKFNNCHGLNITI